MICKDVGQLLLNMEFYVSSIFGNDAMVDLTKSSKKDKWLTVKIFINSFAMTEEAIDDKIEAFEEELIDDEKYYRKEAFDKIDIRYIFLGDRNGQLWNKIE